MDLKKQTIESSRFFTEYCIAEIMPIYNKMRAKYNGCELGDK